MTKKPVVHFEIGCKDRPATRAFYEQAFGWDFSDYGPYADRAETGGPVRGHLTSLGHEPHNYVMVYIETDDVSETLKTAIDAGGQAIVGPLPTPDGGEFAWLKDPAGNQIGLIRRP